MPGALCVDRIGVEVLTGTVADHVQRTARLVADAEDPLHEGAARLDDDAFIGDDFDDGTIDVS